MLPDRRIQFSFAYMEFFTIIDVPTAQPFAMEIYTFQPVLSNLTFRKKPSEKELGIIPTTLQPRHASIIEDFQALATHTQWV
jgi:hypothetical protein